MEMKELCKKIEDQSKELTQLLDMQKETLIEFEESLDCVKFFNNFFHVNTQGENHVCFH